MCEPTTMLAIASVAATAFSAVTQIQGQNAMAKASAEKAKVDAENIRASTVSNYAQSNRQGIEDRENVAIEQQRLERERVARLGSARVAAAGSGIGGLSVDALLLNLSGKGLEAQNAAEVNYTRTTAARSDQALALGLSGASQMNQIRQTPRAGAMDYIGAGLNIAGSYNRNFDPRTGNAR